MNRSESELQTASLHAAYEAVTGYKVELTLHRMYWWGLFIKHRTPAFTEEDIGMVVRYIRHGISKGERNWGALKFSNLIEQPEKFEEDYNLALQAMRPRQPKTKTVHEGGFNKIVENDGCGENTKRPSDFCDPSKSDSIKGWLEKMREAAR